MITTTWTGDNKRARRFRLDCPGCEGRVEGALCGLCGGTHTATFELIREEFLDKEKVKESIRKHIIGSNLVRSKVCEKPYGDTCGYCHKCNQNQELVINAILQDLGIEEAM